MLDAILTHPASRDSGSYQLLPKGHPLHLRPAGEAHPPSLIPLSPICFFKACNSAPARTKRGTGKTVPTPQVVRTEAKICWEGQIKL